MPKAIKKRRKRKGHYNRGTYVSLKTGQICKHRSGWELSYMKWLDENVDVFTWSYEKVIIPYMSNAKTKKMRKYYPDFLVEYVDGHSELIEIKPLRRVHQVKVQKKLLAASDWCRAHSSTLKIVSELELKGLGLL